MTTEQVMGECDTTVFSRVVYAAERVGKPVALVALPGKDLYRLILQAAKQLRSARVVVSRSSGTSLDQQEREMREAWHRLPSPRPAVSVKIVPRDDKEGSRQIDFEPRPADTA